MSSQSSASERRPLLHRNLSRGSDRSTNTMNSYTTVPQSPRTVLPSPNIFSNQSPHHRVLKTRLARAAILLSLVFERIAFYGLAGNLVLFLNLAPFNWVSYFAVDASLYFFGLSFVTSLIGGWLADSVLGRFKTILISFFIYLAGYSCLPWLSKYNGHNTLFSPELPSICWDSQKIGNATSDTDNPFDEPCAGVIFIVLTVIAIGTGFVKANIAPFGSDQVAREGQQATLSFFNWFYWSINVGALIGLLLITAIQQQFTFLYGFIASASCLGLAAVIFFSGRCCYYVRPPDGSVLSNIFRILCEAFRRKRLRHQQIMIKNVSQSYVRHGGMKDVDEADPETNISFLDYAKHRHGGIFHDALVDDVKQLKKIFAVFAVLIPYWIGYFQMETTFMIQGLHMRLTDPFQWSMGSNQTKLQIIDTESNSTGFSDISDRPFIFRVPPAWFSVFDVVVLIIFLPLADKVIYPFIERRRRSPVSITCRILLGMIFAMTAMICAGVLEHFRLKVFWPYSTSNATTICKNNTIIQTIGGSQYQAADLTILLQIPQYVLLGLSEVFTSVAGLQFAVTVAPRSMKSIIMALFYMFSGIGSLLGTALISALSSYHIFFDNTDHGNINCRSYCDGTTYTSNNTSNNYDYHSCHLDYFFFLLAGVEFVGILLFLFIAKRFHLDEHHRQSRSQQLMSEAATSDFMDPADTRPAGRYRPVHKKTTRVSIQGYPSDVSSGEN